MHAGVALIELTVGAACLLGGWFAWKTVRLIAILLLVLGVAAAARAGIALLT